MSKHAHLKIRITPRASKASILVQSTDLVKVYVMTPPVKGQANASVCKLIAEHLGLPISNVSLLKGHSSKDKLVRIEGYSLDEVIEKLTGRLF